MTRLLAFDTSTHLMSLALLTPAGVLARDVDAGPKASAQLVPQAQALLAEAGCDWAALDAFAFGQGPGAFTGLRTACSVVQGLAFGAGKPVLPIDSLMIVAEDAAVQHPVLREDELWVAMDARMDEVYAASYRCHGAVWQVVTAPALYTLDALGALWQAAPPRAVAGSAISAFGERLRLGGAFTVPNEQARSQALATLALQAWQAGAAVDAAQALPLYLRDKVALTTQEREDQRLAKEAALPVEGGAR